ncbi:MAG: hypothetical protein F6J96_32020 [Symploca sp. SIO1C2]|nr:hypothetical protein [Symploca sp. SIO1C2]
MKQISTIIDPQDFLVEDYQPGLTIDFKDNGDFSKNQKFERLFSLDSITEANSDSEIEKAVGSSLFKLELAESFSDFKASLNKFVGTGTLDWQLQQTLRELGIFEAPFGRLKKIKLLLEQVGCLKERKHYPVRLYCHIPGETTFLEDCATHFGYVMEGECVIVDKDRKVPFVEGMYFSIAGECEIQGNGLCEVITRFEYVGITHFGGKVEPWGRLNYIDGCTDTILVHPSKKGDPCYNALYFPESIEQTQHVHPSLRCGLVIAGEGVCKTPFGDFNLSKGKIFFLPPETYHSFHTYENKTGNQSALTVVAFHPDSDFGPTDEDHPMVNRTYFKFVHRLMSSARTIQLNC